MRQKILLIQPLYYRLFKDTYSLDRFPLSLGYLASAVRKETAWDVMVYNADFYPESVPIEVGYLVGNGFNNYLRNLKDHSAKIWEDIKVVISEYQPTVVGISAHTQNFASACVIANLIKKISEQIIIVVGGPHPSMVGKDILNCPDIDIAVMGEGELTIVELLKELEKDKKIDNIQGIVYRKDGKIVENFPREFIKDLDTLCFPHEYAKEVLKDYEKYPASSFRYVFATRGCLYACFFCGSHKIWSRRPRFRSPGNIIKEIRAIQGIGLKAICFEDDTFGITKEYLSQLCNALIKDCPGLKWRCELHVKLVDEETISLMKRAGCYSISIGLESGNNDILKRIMKNITIEEALLACRIIKRHRIELNIFFIIGFPWETEDTLDDTISAIRKIDCDYLIYNIFTPYPGTEAFELCKKNGLIKDSYDISLYHHQGSANCFCLNIAPGRFRELASKIEKMVDEKNRLSRIKQVFSPTIIWKVQELGIGKSLAKARRTYFSRV